MSDHGVWRSSILRHEWGFLAPLLRPRGFDVVLRVQLAAASVLLAAGGTLLGACCTAVLCATTLLSAMRFRGTVNGGSDGMLFTVLAGLTVAQLPLVVPPLREAGVLYIAAQLSLSYLRAGVVKVRVRGWWSGRALQAFLTLPAYGVPRWVPPWATTNRPLLQCIGVATMAFECAVPLAWTGPAACLCFIAAAFTFHFGVAAIFGLNRFLWAWSAALPSLWYAVHRVANGA
jgi:hypothetical protein